MKAMWLSVGILAVFGAVGAAGTAYAAGDVQAGKAKSASCAGCHGANGEGKGAYPALAGRTEHEIEEALDGLQIGGEEQRDHAQFRKPPQRQGHRKPGRVLRIAQGEMKEHGLAAGRAVARPEA